MKYCALLYEAHLYILMFHTYLNMFLYLFGHEFAPLSSYNHISIKMCSHLLGHNFAFLRSGAAAMTRLREGPMIVIRPPGGILFKDFIFICVILISETKSARVN